MAILAKHFVTTVACLTIITLQMIAVLENIQAFGYNSCVHDYAYSANDCSAGKDSSMQLELILE